MTLERNVEARLHRKIVKLGGYTIKLMPTVAGVPDRLVILPGGAMRLVELKIEGGRVSPVQKAFHERLRALGTPVAVLAGNDQVDQWIQKEISA